MFGYKGFHENVCVSLQVHRLWVQLKKVEWKNGRRLFLLFSLGVENRNTEMDMGHEMHYIEIEASKHLPWKYK